MLGSERRGLKRHKQRIQGKVLELRQWQAARTKRASNRKPQGEFAPSDSPWERFCFNSDFALYRFGSNNWMNTLKRKGRTLISEGRERMSSAPQVCIEGLSTTMESERATFTPSDVWKPTSRLSQFGNWVARRPADRPVRRCDYRADSRTLDSQKKRRSIKKSINQSINR